MLQNQKGKFIREEFKDQNENFGMEILAEGFLDKELIVTGKTSDGKKPWKTIYKIIDNGYFNQADVEFPKQFY